MLLIRLEMTRAALSLGQHVAWGRGGPLGLRFRGDHPTEPLVV